MSTSCAFCRIVRGDAPAALVRAWPYALAFVPLNPVTPGHVLVVPRRHVRDVSDDPATSAMTMQAAAELAQEVGPCNVITSAGTEATQTVFHLHLHIVPRCANDGLSLPWTPRDDSTAA
jgi:histidine triad (HIT) family protein